MTGGMEDFEQMSEIELLQTHGLVIGELLRRGVVKTRNNPVGDYTEWLVCRRLGLEMQANSKASFDAVDAAGIRYQIKGRRSEGRSVQFSAIRNLVEQGFDFVIAVIFNNDYSIRLAVMMPYATVVKLVKYQPHVNAHNLILTDNIVGEDGVMNIVQQIIGESESTGGDRGIFPTPQYEVPHTLQSIVQSLMRTTLEDYPTLLADADISNLMNQDYCRDELHLKSGNLPLLRAGREGRMINGHSRYWTKLYASRFYVCSQWWKDHHLDNARSLRRFVAELAQRNPDNPGIWALKEHEQNLTDYLN